MGVPNDNTIKPKQMGPVATAALGIGTQIVYRDWETDRKSVV